jgi:hypothetical protein
MKQAVNKDGGVVIFPKKPLLNFELLRAVIPKKFVIFYVYLLANF